MRQTAWVISWLKQFIAAAGWFSCRNKTIGEASVVKAIDGWQDNQTALRIDYVFASQNEQPVEYEVVFDGQRLPIVSDHFGICVVLNNQE